MRSRSQISRLVAAILAISFCVSCLRSAWALGAEAGPGGEVARRVLARPSLPEAGFSPAQQETVWFGHKATSPDPNKVAVGGRWDFDSGVAGTDSTQFWSFLQAPYDGDADGYPQPSDRYFWYFDYGNNVNRGNHNLWSARGAAGRAFRRTGLAGVWHVDDMSTVPGSAGNISGARSAWCGLRYTGDPDAPVDEYTGNPFTNAEQYNDFRGGGAVRSGFPGYADQWNQLLYRDFPYTGQPVGLTFKYRAQLSPAVAADPGGSAWFSPDPTDLGNLVLNPADSLMVWVGAPKETGVYDPNRRWLSETLDFSLGPQKLFAVTGYVPADSVGFVQASLWIPPAQWQWGSMVRVVFQVHTNRSVSDLATQAGAFNSRDGAVVLDDVLVGETMSGFETGSEIRPRMANGWVDPRTAWITTGKPPASYGHVHDVWGLPYDDPLGAIGSPTRACNLIDAVLVQGDHDYMEIFRRESSNWAISPTICLSGPRSSLQGAPADLRSTTSHIDIEFDYYSGFDDPTETGVFFWYAVRYLGQGLPSLQQPVAPAVSNWSPFHTPDGMGYFGSPTCTVYETDLGLMGQVPLANVDSLQIGLETLTRCGRFGAMACGESRGGYWDNIRVGFVPIAAPVAGMPEAGHTRYGDGVPGGPALDRLGVSPANRCVAPAYQYFYRVQLRDGFDQAVVGFPADLVWLDFSAGPPAYGRPANGRVHPDGDSDAEGILEWRRALSFGGADPDSVRLYVSVGADSVVTLFHVIPGGVRSPDQDGDGFVTPMDIDLWNQAYAAGDSLWRGDLGPSALFDDLITVADSTGLAAHRDCLLCYESVVDEGATHRLIVQGIVDHDAQTLRGMIKVSSGTRDTTVRLAPAGDGLLHGAYALELAGAGGENIRCSSSYLTHTNPDSLAEEHADSIRAVVPVASSADSAKLSLETRVDVRPTKGECASEAELKGLQGNPLGGDLSIKVAEAGRPTDKGTTQSTDLTVGVKGQDASLSCGVTQTDSPDGSQALTAHAQVTAKVDSTEITLKARSTKKDGDVQNGADVKVKKTIAESGSIYIIIASSDLSEGVDKVAIGGTFTLLGIPLYGEFSEKRGDHSVQGSVGVDLLKWLFPDRQVMGLSSSPGAIAEQRVSLCCDGVCEEMPVVADTIAMPDTCGAVTLRSAVDLNWCVPAESLVVAGVPCGVVGADDGEVPVPRELGLAQVVPNPALGVTTIHFEVPRSGDVDLSVFDVRGRRIIRLVGGPRSPGRFRVSWNARDENGARVPAGVYFARLALGSERRTQRFILLRQ